MFSLLCENHTRRPFTAEITVVVLFVVVAFAIESCTSISGRNRKPIPAEVDSAWRRTTKLQETEHHSNLNLAIDPSPTPFSLSFLLPPSKMTSLKILVPVKRVIDYAVRRPPPFLPPFKAPNTPSKSQTTQLTHRRSSRASTKRARASKQPA